MYEVPIIKKERLAYIEQVIEKEQDRTNSGRESVQIRLIDVYNREKQFAYELRDSAILGRKSNLCDIAVEYDRTISSKQCRFSLRLGKVYVFDLGSTNHTYRNDRLVEGECLLQDGDVLGVGRINLKIYIS